MESLVALSFAANVVQFAEFTTRVISKSIKIYRARTHSGADHIAATDLGELELELFQYTEFIDFDDKVREKLNQKPLRKKLQEMGLPPMKVERGRIAYNSAMLDLNEETRGALKAERVVELSPCDKEIFRMCFSCEDVALSLRQGIAKLKSSSRSIMWSSFAEALRTIWAEEKFQTMAHQLKDLRERMMVLLLISFREKAQESLSAQQSGFKDLYNATSRLRNMMDRILQSQEQIKMEIIQAIQKDYQHSSAPRPNGLALDPLQTELSPTSRSQFNKALLQWVRFTEVETRPERIASAYEKTFEWIYRPPLDGQWSEFTTWLEDEAEPLYWITGKPAAGKSTLLKFIHNDPRTAEYLGKWAGDMKLINCAFYFWNSGVPIQMSKEGMLRTLLYKALLQAPELWAKTFPSKMEEYILFAEPFQRPITNEETEQAFQLLLQGAGTDYRLFFLIDGLDEYGEDRDQLVAMIKRFLSPHVKTCVSSRDWSVFEDGFQKRPRLRLEVLTRTDIKQYVTSRFSDSPASRERQLETPDEVEALMESLTTKASGVFLWVRLVTDSLLKGLASGERIEELHERLNAVPVDLEDLFWKILTDVQPEHRTHMSQLLQTMRCPPEPLTLLDFSYADELNPEIVSKTLYGALSPVQAEGRALTMHRRLKACCKGLLQAEQTNEQSLASTSVTYLHRMVRDYLDRPEIWSEFQGMTDNSFNLSIRMYNMYVIRIKRMFQVDSAFDEGFWAAVLHAIGHAIHSDPEDETGRQVSLLTQLDEVAAYTAKPRLSGTATHWSSLRKGGRMNSSFLHLAIQLQLDVFVRHTLFTSPTPSSKTTDTQCDTTKMLLLATLYYDSFAKDQSSPPLSFIPHSPSEDLVELFLLRGADPNFRIPDALRDYGNITGHYSSWEAHLREPNRGSKSWAALSVLFLENGADPALVNDSIPNIPQEIVTLARLKAKGRRDEMKRQKLKSFGFLFRVKDFKMKKHQWQISA